MLHVSFLNKNTFRNYPLRGSGGVVSTDGLVVPTSLLSAAQFSVPTSYHMVYASRIYILDNHVNMLIASWVGSAPVYLGVVDADLKTDYQEVKMTPLIDSAYGCVTFGRLSALDTYQGFHTLTNDASRFEDSTVTVVPVPSLKAIIHDGASLAGKVKFTYNNIKELPDPSALSLAVVNLESVRAVNDTSSKYRNCGKYPIGSINQVTPNPAVEQYGNIDIYGIKPVEVHVLAGGLVFSVPTIDKAEVCASVKQLPPLITNSRYLKNITEAVAPEWKGWPQFKDK